MGPAVGGPQEFIGQPNSQYKQFSVQWKTVSQGNKVESDRERYPVSCSGFCMQHTHKFAYLQGSMQIGAQRKGKR